MDFLTKIGTMLLNSSVKLYCNISCCIRDTKSYLQLSLNIRPDVTGHDVRPGSNSM